MSAPRHYKGRVRVFARGCALARAHTLSVVFTQTTSLCTHAYDLITDFKDPRRPSENYLGAWNTWTDTQHAHEGMGAALAATCGVQMHPRLEFPERDEKS